MTLTANEFIRRFLLHVLPPGFHRICHYGLIANTTRQRSLTQARELLMRQTTPDNMAHRHPMRLAPTEAAVTSRLPMFAQTVAPPC